MLTAQPTCAEQDFFPFLRQDFLAFIEFPSIASEAERVTGADVQRFFPNFRVLSNILGGINADLFVFTALLSGCFPDQPATARKPQV
jgi:hypothetical protein